MPGQLQPGIHIHYLVLLVHVDYLLEDEAHPDDDGLRGVGHWPLQGLVVLKQLAIEVGFFRGTQYRRRREQKKKTHLSGIFFSIKKEEDRIDNFKEWRRMTTN